MQLAIVTVYESGIRITKDASGNDDVETPIERELAEYLVRIARNDTDADVEAMTLKRHQDQYHMGDRAKLTDKLDPNYLLDGYAITQTIGEWHLA